jgi:predicted nucleotide-binding protein
VKKLPEPQFLVNTIVRQFDVPRAHAEVCATMFVENMEFVGLVKARGKDKYLSAQAIPVIADEDVIDVVVEDEPNGSEADAVPHGPDNLPSGGVITPVLAPVSNENNRVFISHGKNTAIVGQLKDLLMFGHFEPVVSVERETTSRPVPDKVMDDMRACGAGIIHVGTERKVLDAEGNEHSMINQNVLIEIGAAMALYGRRFILLTEPGTTLPSNLQGLYEVRLEGNELDHPATMKLLKAFNDFKR